jgi:hypothetical protein
MTPARCRGAAERDSASREFPQALAQARRDCAGWRKRRERLRRTAPRYSARTRDASPGAASSLQPAYRQASLSCSHPEHLQLHRRGSGRPVRRRRLLDRPGKRPDSAAVGQLAPRLPARRDRAQRILPDRRRVPSKYPPKRIGNPRPPASPRRAARPRRALLASLRAGPEPDMPPRRTRSPYSLEHRSAARG